MTATSWVRAHIGPIGRTAVVWIGLTLLAVAATLAVLLLREPVDGPAREPVGP